jgi:hypothetical protein
MLKLLPLVLVLGCAGPPETVVFSGTVRDQPYGGGKPVAGVQVTERDADFEKAATATTADDGTFSMVVGAVQDFYVELSGDGFVPTIFAGEMGAYDFNAGDETLFVRSDAAPDALRTEFDAWGTAGATIEGEVRLYQSGVSFSKLPPVGNAFVNVIDGEGNSYSPRYLDAKGAPDPKANTTGATGRFAFFDLPEGPLQLDVAYGKVDDDSGAYDTGDPNDSDDAWHWYYRTWLLEGAIAPFYPALVEMR